MPWRDGDVCWIVVWPPPGPVPQRVVLTDPLGHAAAGRESYHCWPADEAGNRVESTRSIHCWLRWPAEVLGTRGEALERCKAWDASATP